jgi:hypothetical protein
MYSFSVVSRSQTFIIPRLQFYEHMAGAGASQRPHLTPLLRRFPALLIVFDTRVSIHTPGSKGGFSRKENVACLVANANRFPVS